MADIVFNIAKGKVGYYATLPAANDALIIVPIESVGIEADSILQDYDDLSALLAAANNEQTTMGRQTLSSVTSTVNDTTNKLLVDAVDVVWPAATGNATAALVICYDPDTTTGTDTTLIPLVKLDFARTPSGADIVALFHSDGFFSAS